MASTLRVVARALAWAVDFAEFCLRVAAAFFPVVDRFVAAVARLTVVVYFVAAAALAGGVVVRVGALWSAM